MLSKVGIRAKIALMAMLGGIGFIVVFFANSLVRESNEKLMQEIENEHVAALELSRDLEETLLGVQYALQGAVAAGEEDELELAHSFHRVFLEQLQSGKDNPAFELDYLLQLESAFNQYYKHAWQTSLQMLTGTLDESTVADLEIMSQRYNQIRFDLDASTGHQKVMMRRAFEVSRENYETSSALINFVTICVTLIFSGMAIYISTSINRPLREIVAAARELATGNVDVQLNFQAKDEFGKLARAFAELVRATNSLSSAARAIGKGDYSVPVQVRSQRDVLGNALASMKSDLVNNLQESKRQDWLKTGQTEFANQVSGLQEVKKLAAAAIKFLTTYTSGLAGSIYLLHEDDRLHLVSDYGAFRRSGDPKVFPLGKGLIGQVGQDQERRVIADIEAHHLRVTGDLLDAPCSSLIYLPLLFEDTLVGVLELGKLGEFSDNELLLLDQIVPRLAINFHSVKSRQRLQKLLEETREQTLELERQKEVLSRKNRELETTRKLVEEKAADLEQANRYKSQFLANMSHELRTPLNGMLILSKLLAENRESNLSAQDVDHAQIIHRSGKDLLILINDILDLSKVEAGKLQLHFEPYALADLTRNTLDTFSHVAEEKQLDFQVVRHADLPEAIKTDAQRLNQILRNLIGNAFKFTREGSVELRIHPKSVGDGNTDLAAVIFEVTDTGIGIPEAKQRLIFQAFQQADGSISRQYGGTGLGLSISKELSQLLGGELSLTSELDVGTTFRLELPVAIGDSTSSKTGEAEERWVTESYAFLQQPTEAVSPSESTSERELQIEHAEEDVTDVSSGQHDVLKDCSVLIVDSDVRFLFRASQALESLGIKTEIARNCDAVAEIISSGAKFEVVVAEDEFLFSMKERCGELSSQFPLTDSLLIALCPENGSAFSEAQLIADFVVLKPVEIDLLSKEIVRLLENETEGRSAAVLGETEDEG